MVKYEDITGKKFNYLTPIEKLENYKPKSRNSYWRCICDCGNEKISVSYDITSGRVLSCGCAVKRGRRKKRKRIENTLPKSHKRMYSIWSSMKNRCYDANNSEYKHYEAKGITVCESWLSDFYNFKNDMYDSYLEFEKLYGENSPTIDRIYSTGNYEPNNCRWQNYTQQARNSKGNIKVEVDGIEFNTISELSEYYNVNYQTVLGRYNRGVRGIDLVSTNGIKINSHYTGTNNKRTSK